MNPYDLAGWDDDDEDRLEYEEFAKLTEAEQEAVIEQALKEHDVWWQSLSPQEKYRIARREALKCLASARKYLKRAYLQEASYALVVEQIKKMQQLARMRLVKARAFRATGMWPGYS